MKRSNDDSSTPDSSSKRGKRDETNDEQGPSPVFLQYEHYEQFKELMEEPHFVKKLGHISNEDIIHRIVVNTRNNSEDDVDGRKKVLTKIISNRLALLHSQAYDEWHTPLHQPNIHMELIKFLIERGVPIYSVTRSCQLSFVHLTTTYFNPEEFHELVKYLLEMGFDKLIRTRDCYGMTPIHLAVYNMEVKEQTILLCRDAEQVQFDLMNDVDVKGNSLLTFAVMGGRSEGYLSLLQGLGALPMVNSLGYSVLHHAAVYGNLDAIKLFGHGDLLDLEAPGGLTPVHVALYSGRRNIHDVVKLLLERCQGYVALPDDEGQTPLWWAKNGPLKGIIEPRTVELLQKELADFKPLLKHGISTRARGSMETNGRGTPEVEHVDQNNEGETVDVTSSADAGSEGDRRNEENANNLVSDELKCFDEEEHNFHGEALQVLLDDHANQDASPNASEADAAEETGEKVVAAGSPICNMESEISDSDTDSEPEDVLENSADASNGSNSDGTGINEAIHGLVSNTLDCSCEEVESKKNAITAILQSCPESLNTKVGKDEKTPLLCERVHVELLKFLILKGADVSATTKEKKESILHLAALYLGPKHYHELVIIVQKSNRKVLKTVNSRQEHALDVACSKMEVEKETLITFRNSGVDLTGDLLRYAVEGGRTVEFLKTLSSLGLKPEKICHGVSLVHYAALHSSLEGLKYMIELVHGRKSRRCRFQSVLYFALEKQRVITEDHVKISYALLHEYGAKHRLKEKKMRDIVHCLVRFSFSTECSSPEEIERRKKIIDMLVDCDNTLLNEKFNGETTLLELYNVHPELLKHLILKGCDPRQRYSRYGSGFQVFNGFYNGKLSAEQFHDFIVFLVDNGYQDMLESEDSNGRTTLHYAVKYIELKEETIQVFETHGGLKIVDKYGWNIIFHATDGDRSPEFVKMLMNKADMGVDDIDMNQERGVSAAHIAAEKGNVELLKLFLELKPGLANKENRLGKTPLQLLVKNIKGDMKRLECVKLLLNDFKIKKLLKQDDMQKLIRCIQNVGSKSKEAREERSRIME